jgi:hypothetical protein
MKAMGENFVNDLGLLPIKAIKGSEPLISRIQGL